MNGAPDNRRDMKALVQIVEALRGERGCPWDKEQTHQTLTRYAIEEAFELAEAIDKGDLPHMIEELGDLLLQVILHAEIGRQAGQFTLADVIESICDKMVRRHPHVFGGADLKTSAEVLDQWGKIKATEKPTKKNGFGLPPGLPALLASQKIGEKTRKVKFDWETSDQVLEKLKEEIAEFADAKDAAARQSELGDILFTAAQLARFIDTDAEQTLRQANQRFEKRFFKMHEMTDDFDSLSADEKERLWQRAKKSLV